MDNSEKAQAYGQLLNQHTRLSNKISEIKGSNIDLTKEQLKEIKNLENQQLQIMSTINKLFS